MISDHQRKKIAAKHLAKSPGKFEQLDLSEMEHPYWMTRAYRNNAYTVMVNDVCPTDKGTAIRVMVQKHNNMPFINHWSEMQKIKNEIFGSETVAIEYYPKESDLINDHNIYWMWIFPEGILPIPIINK